MWGIPTILKDVIKISAVKLVRFCSLGYKPTLLWWSSKWDERTCIILMHSCKHTKYLMFIIGFYSGWLHTEIELTCCSINWSDILRNLKLFRMFCILPGVKRKKTNKKTQITEITERFWSKQFQNNFLITAAFHPSPWNDLPSRTAGCRKDSRQETPAKTYFRLFLHVPLIEFARWMLPFSIPVIIQPCALVLSYIHSENPRAQRNLSLIMPLGASLSHIFIVHYHYTSCTGKA